MVRIESIFSIVFNTKLKMKKYGISQYKFPSFFKEGCPEAEGWDGEVATKHLQVNGPDALYFKNLNIHGLYAKLIPLFGGARGGFFDLSWRRVFPFELSVKSVFNIFGKTMVQTFASLIAMALLIIPSITHAQSWEIERKGTNSSAFLLIGTNAKVMALGGEGAGLTGLSSVMWNPALSVLNPHLGFSHEEGDYIVDTQHRITVAHIPVDYRSSFDVTLNVVDYGEEEITTVLKPDGTGQYFSMQSWVASVNYARSLTDKVTAGLNLKYLEETIYMEQNHAVALDFGVGYINKESRLTLGMSVQNIGTSNAFESGPHTRYITEESDIFPGSPTPIGEYELKEYPLPLIFRLGATKGFRFPSISTKNIDLLKLNIGFSDGLTTPFRVSTGLEINPIKYISLRGGYRFNDDLANLSAGFGINIPMQEGLQFMLNYAWVDAGYFGASERYQIQVVF